MWKTFNREKELKIYPKPLTVDEVFQRQENFIVFGKNKVGPVERNIWTKRSVFFDLPYWSRLDVRHYLDVMHLKKNMCDSLIGTLLSILGKTKDNKNSCLDMVEMGIR